MSLKKYLNKKERKHLSAFMILDGMISDAINQWEDNLTTDEQKRLKTASTHICKALQSIIDRVGVKEAERVYKKIDENDLIFAKKKPYKSESKSDNKQDLIRLELEKNEFYDLMDGVITSYCGDCNRSDYKNCNIRDILFSNDVPKFNPYADSCQYKLDNRQEDN